MLDVFFITMGEEGSESNWTRLLKFAPAAQRVENVKGIYEVHKRCAELSNTENFWVVDSDAWILDDFDFDFVPSQDVKRYNVPENECVLVWPSRNPVNDLVYGYGGIKLFPKKPFLEKRKWVVDLSTTIGRASFSMTQVSCITKFNTTPQSAWIGAFRECTKLASLSLIKSRVNRAKLYQQIDLENLANYVATQSWEDDKKSNYRKAQSRIIIERYLEESNIITYWNDIVECGERRFTWCTVGNDRPNGEYAIDGARLGTQFGLMYGNDNEQLTKINDWDWLMEEFNNVYV
jgi:hypothetical protein